MKFLNQQANQILANLKDNKDKLPHVFDPKDIQAVNAALATGRPLLIRGEPGVGKTQMAKAVALVLARPLLSLVVDSRTESRDLLWHFDAIERLAEAQILGNIEKDRDKAKQALAIENFIKPGPFWWALNWTDAKSKNNDCDPGAHCQNTGSPQNGCIVLIDEIDKAESDVPNGLLEVLSETHFSTPFGGGFRVELTGQPAPLVMITTNEERDLPPAFIRRCVVRHIKLPRDERGFKAALVERGKIHFGAELEDTVYQKAADLIYRERKACEEQQLNPLPGQAEYIDLLTAANQLKAQGLDAGDAMDDVAEYIIKKHTDTED